MATTGVRVGEAQSRRHSATGPREEIAPAERRPGLTAEGSGSSLIPGSRQPPQQRDVPEAGDGQTPVGSGQTFAVGGNMLNGWFPDAGAQVPRLLCGRFFAVPVWWAGSRSTLATQSEPVELNSLRSISVEHEYPALSAGVASVVYDATIRDEHGQVARLDSVSTAAPSRPRGKTCARGHPASTIV